MLSVTRAIFKFLPLVILQIGYFYSLPFCKFSYLDQFYRYKLANLLNHFFTECSSLTRTNFLSFFLCILIGKNFFCTVFLHLVQTNYIGLHVQFIYIVLPQCFIRHTCYFLSFSLVILQKKFLYSFTLSQI